VKGQINKSILNSRLQRSLRNTMTDAELRLWQCLRRRQMDGFKFRRQHPFDNYILDFVCMEAMLVIEVDGGQHGDHGAGDMIRTAVLEKAGFRVLRFWNNEVLNEIEVVKESIWQALHNPSPSHPSP
jgi:very-short-patch-repair endonuclease